MNSVTRTQNESCRNTDPYDETHHTIENLNLRQLLGSSKKERWSLLCSPWYVTGGVFQALLFATLRLNWHVIGSIYQVSQRVTLEQRTLRATIWHLYLFQAQSEFCNDTLFTELLTFIVLHSDQKFKAIRQLFPSATFFCSFRLQCSLFYCVNLRSKTRGQETFCSYFIEDSNNMAFSLDRKLLIIMLLTGVILSETAQNLTTPFFHFSTGTAIL